MRPRRHAVRLTGDLAHGYSSHAQRLRQMRRVAAVPVEIVIIVMVVLLVPGILHAQNTTSSPRERLGVGAVGSAVLGAFPWSIVSGRISIPMGTRFGVDVDAGKALNTKRLSRGQVPTGGAVGLHLRWLHGRRRPSGWSGYFFGGPRVVAGENITQDGQVIDHDPIKVFDLGYGFDRLMQNGWRAGVELGGGGGEGPLLFVSGFVLWGRH